MELQGHMGSVAFDGHVVTISKTMRGQVSIPVSSVGSVVIIPAGIGMRGIKFTAEGSSVVKKAKAKGSHGKLAKDPYALTFKKAAEPEFAALMQQVLAARIRGR